MIFGLLNPEKLWHENLTHLFTSPVRCSHFALESQKVSFNSIVYTYFWLLNIFFRLVKRLYRHYINHNQILFTLTFRSLSEIVVRRSFSILLPVLATVVMWRGKKSVVRVAQNLQSWIRNLREVPDGLRKQCTSERREGVLWTGTRTVIHWATRTSFCSQKEKGGLFGVQCTGIAFLSWKWRTLTVQTSDSTVTSIVIHAMHAIGLLQHAWSVLVSLSTACVSDRLLRRTWHASQRIRASSERATRAPCSQ